MKFDVIIIGSGISGLTAATIFAKQNKKVLILEANKKPGGALKRFKRDNISFDVGFHYTGCLGEGEILRALWDYLGVMPHIKTVPFPQDGCDLIKIKGSSEQIKCYFSYEKLSDELCSKFPREVDGIKEYLKIVREICCSIPFYNLELPLTPFLRGFVEQGISLKKLLSSLVKDPFLQAALTSPSLLYGVPPKNAGMFVHASIAHAYYSGAYGIKGGGQSIVDAFLKVFDQLDVKILTSSKVQSIHVENNKVAGVVSDENIFDASTVIYTGHPTKLLEIIPEKIFRPAYIHRLEDLVNTDSMFVVFGKSKSGHLAEKLKWTNFYSLNPGMDSLEPNSKKPDDSPLLVTAPGLKDNDFFLSGEYYPVIILRASSWEEVSEFIGSNRKSISYAKWKEKNCSKLLDQVRKQFNFETCEITPLATSSPLTFQDELKAPQGAVYGPQYCLGQHNPSARTKLNGLYLSGQGTFMPGVVGASLSGLVSAGEALGLEPIWDAIRKCR